LRGRADEKKEKAAPATTAQIIKLPHPDFNFEPYEFEGGSVLASYDRDRTLVEIVDRC